MPTPTKTYYSMREVIAKTDLAAATLRYWEQQFSQLAPRKDGHGNRYYTQEDIDLILRIKYIRDELKITRLDAIRRELNTDDHKADARKRATDILLRLREELEGIRSAL